MSDPSNAPEEQEPVRRFLRFDLSGKKITNWTVNVRNWLADKLQPVADAPNKVKKAKVPGTDDTLEDVAKRAPASSVKALEATLAKPSVENELKSAQTETELVKQQLLRAQTANTEADTQSKQLDNLSRELELRKQILEITEGRADITVEWHDGKPNLIIGNVPQVDNRSDVSRLNSEETADEPPPVE